MTAHDDDGFARAARATVRRIAAENTWLRHSLMEMEARVAAMKTQLTQLETGAREARKALAPAATDRPQRTTAQKATTAAKVSPHDQQPTPAAKSAARKATTQKGSKR